MDIEPIRVKPPKSGIGAVSAKVSDDVFLVWYRKIWRTANSRSRTANKAVVVRTRRLETELVKFAVSQKRNSFFYFGFRLNFGGRYDSLRGEDLFLFRICINLGEKTRDM